MAGGDRATGRSALLLLPFIFFDSHDIDSAFSIETSETRASPFAEELISMATTGYLLERYNLSFRHMIAKRKERLLAMKTIWKAVNNDRSVADHIPMNNVHITDENLYQIVSTPRSDYAGDVVSMMQWS